MVQKKHKILLAFCQDFQRKNQSVTNVYGYVILITYYN
jgi:hypothetical protein